MPYITSTATSGTDYVLYKSTETGLKIPAKVVTINGGANCANKLFVTRSAVSTKVSDEELEMLRQNPEFARHLENGFLNITKIEKESVKGLQEGDASAPMTPEKYKSRGRKAPSIKAEG